MIPNKIRSKKLSTRVDLTAMVSVSFLLIIFFMVTIELSKPKAVDLSLPGNDWTCGRAYNSCSLDVSRIITVLLDDNDKVIIYSGFLFAPISDPQELNYGKNGIREELFNKRKSILEYSTALGKPRNGPIVIIKPSKKSNFKNLVDILDEMALTNIETYVIVSDFTPEETKLLASK